MRYYLIHLAAPNDVNGNPRRAYVIFDEAGTLVDVRDEGYRGYDAYSKDYPAAVYLGRVPTTPAYYREVLKEGRKK